MREQIIKQIEKYLLVKLTPEESFKILNFVDKIGDARK